jgi:actin-like ATPase involved in cell morphogenesis
MGIGLDVGTSFLIQASESDEGIVYKEFRDAFYRMKPATPIAAKMMEKGLQNLSYFKDEDSSFVIVGQDAIEKAIERNQSALRPLHRGVISPKEPDARRVLKFILTKLVGRPTEPGETLVYSIPAEPVDQSDEDFNTGFHEDCLRKDLGELGWNAQPMNEAEAICYSELSDNDYTGICMSFGAGMVNVCVMSSGEPVVRFSTTKSGDWIDRMAAQSTGQTDSVVQVEKENGDFTVGEESSNSILSAVSAYYVRLVDYTVQHLAAHLTNSKDLPKFTDSVPVVVSGGTSRAQGFVEAFKARMSQENFPVQVREVRHAKDPLRAVARGCLLAASM